MIYFNYLLGQEWFRNDLFARQEWFRNDLFARQEWFHNDLFARQEWFRIDLFARWEWFLNDTEFILFAITFQLNKTLGTIQLFWQAVPRMNHLSGSYHS